jgi:hypothetical protein
VVSGEQIKSTMFIKGAGSISAETVSKRRLHMKKISTTVIAALMVSVLIAGVSGCKKKEGPMERTGKEIDQAAEKTGQQINKAVKKTGEKIEQTGDKIKESVK